MKIAITRALPEAEDTAAAIRARGAEPIIAPLLEIVPMGYDTSTEGAQAILFTSVHGVAAFPDARGARAIPVLTVGDATAQAARAAGFEHVRSADGDAAALTALALATLHPQAGKLIHIRGAHVAGDVAGQLEAAGFVVDRRIAYTAAQAQKLPAALSQPLDVVLFYSARTAGAYRALGAPHAAARTAACMSQAVADAAGPGWGRVIVSERPREDSVLAAIFGA